MTSIGKRLVAFKLILIMILGILPLHMFPTRVLANAEFLGIYHVNVNVTNEADILAPANYSFTLQWDDFLDVPTPGTGSWLFGDDLLTSGNTRIYVQNLTDPTVEHALVGQLSPDDTNRLLQISDLALNPASIYRFVIRQQIFRIGDGGTPDYTALEQYVIFMTDIPISTQEVPGYNDRFLLEWPLPRIANSPIERQDIFQMYGLRANVLTNHITWDIEQNIDLRAGMQPENLIIREENGRDIASYIWINDGFRPGYLYAMAIEPIHTDINDTFSVSVINEDINIRSLMPPVDIPFDQVATGNLVTPLAPTSPLTRNVFSRNWNMFVRFDTHISPEITILEPNLQTIELNWAALQMPHSAFVNIIQNSIFEHSSLPPPPGGAIAPEGVGSLVVTFGGGMATTTNLPLPVPASQTFFWFLRQYGPMSFTYVHLTGISNVPVDSLEGLQMRSRVAVFNPRISEFTPYRPNIHSITTESEDPITMGITWEAFLREPTEDEQINPMFGRYLDRNLRYRILVTDSQGNFSSDTLAAIPDELFIDLDAADLPLFPVMDDLSTAFFNTLVDSFTYFNIETFEFESRPLQENAIYYVRIQAIRNEMDHNNQHIMSEPAYGAHFIMPINNIPTDPNMLSRPPLRIQLIDGIPQITEDSVTIEWENQWLEVFEESTGLWHSNLAIVDGQLLWGDNVGTQNNILMDLRAFHPNGDLNPANVTTALLPHISIPVVRVMDLRGVSYQVHTVEFAASDNFEAYVQEINTIMEYWVTINPVGTDTLEYTVTTVQNPAGAMQPDTAYIIFIRPFIPGDAGDRIAFFPNFVSATTLTPRPPLEITPIVPILQPVAAGDTYLTVRWEHVSGLYYDLRFSENINDFSEGGVPIDSETIIQNGVIVHIDGRDYIEFTIVGLFPQSPHYIWVRSRAISNETEIISVWSNFIEMITLSLRPPQPPRGLGPASMGSLDIFNRDNETNHTPIGPNHIIVEWMRDPNDTATVPDASGSIEDLMQPLYHPNILNSYMLRFNDLVANRRHYVRAKTVVVISRGTGNFVEREFIYVIQLSLNNQFTDFIEIEIPVTIPTGGATSVTQMESEWVQVSIFTQMTDAEFDGNINPEMVPLPQTDFAVSYNANTSTLIHRFRSNQVDADGNRDNNVDQRFISRLVSDRVFSYQVDVSRHNNRLVENRVVEIPFVIVEAFVERQIDLEIVADNLSVTIPHGSIITNEVKSLPGLARTTRVVISISQETAPDSNVVSTPHNLSVQFIEGVNSITVSDFETPLLLNMRTPSNLNTVSGNVSGYISHANTGGWQRLNSRHNPATNYVSFAVAQPGSYAVIISNPPTNTGATSTALSHMHRVNSNLHIVDMVTFDENATIHANQFNQIIAAVARRQPTVQMNVPLPNDYFVTLGRSGMLVSGETVTRQAGIGSLVRLYEVRTGYPISFFPSIEDTMFVDIIFADQDFQEGLLKAGQIGFFRGDFAEPNANLTMGDLMFILDIILST